MTSNLPPNLLKLFDARPPLPPAKNLPKDYSDIQLPEIDPIAKCLERLKEDPWDDGYVPSLTAEEKRLAEMELKKQQYQESLKRQQQEYQPLTEEFSNDAKKTADAFKTVFVGRLPSSVRSEERLQEIFSHYAPITSVMVPKDLNGNPKSYAFIELEDERDLRSFIRECNGMRLEDRRIVVDVERGRTVPGWQPIRIREDKQISVIKPSAPVVPEQKRKRSRSRSKSPIIISPPPIPEEPVVPVKKWQDTRELRRY